MRLNIENTKKNNKQQKEKATKAQSKNQSRFLLYKIQPLQNQTSNHPTNQVISL